MTEQTLIKKYPNFFSNIGGFECSSGWDSIIENAVKKIQKLDPEVKAVQVKNKFGTLRFYITSATDEVHKIIEDTEKLSETICELCGKPGELRNDDRYWLQTICDDCDLE